MKAYVQTVIAYVQKNFLEIWNTFTGGAIGWAGSSLFKEWIQPVLLTIICAVISLLIGHFGKLHLEKRSKAKQSARIKSNGKP